MKLQHPRPVFAFIAAFGLACAACGDSSATGDGGSGGSTPSAGGGGIGGSGAMSGTGGSGGSGAAAPDPQGSCPVSGKAFAYAVNGTQGPYPINVSADPDQEIWVLSDGRPEVDDSTWIDGQGDWVRGTGNTFGVIAGLAAEMGAEGGWRLVPNTAVAPYFPTRELIDQIFGQFGAAAWQNNGPAGVFAIWGGGAFDGRSFVFGAAGGHNGYAGTELYRVRLTDPPAAVRMFDPIAPEAVFRGPNSSNVLPEFGPRASHTYDSWRFSPVTQTFFFGGSNMMHVTAYGAGGPVESGFVTEFDPAAATPKKAFRRWYPPKGNPPDGRNLLYSDGARLSADGRYYTVVQVDYDGDPLTLDVCSKEWRASTPEELVGGFEWAATARYLPDGRGFTMKATGSNPLTFGIVGATAGNDFSFSGLPDWVGEDSARSQGYLDGGAGMVMVSNKAILWGGDGRVVAVDVTQSSLSSFAPAANEPAPTREADYNGIYGRFAWIPEVGVFVGYGNAAEGAWIFKPPADWAIAN